MKKLILLNFVTNVCVYLTVYLLKTLTIWEFTNPFNWMMNIPNWSPENRLMLPFGIFIWQFFQIKILKDDFKVK